jgi:hypothetical protein
MILKDVAITFGGSHSLRSRTTQSHGDLIRQKLEIIADIKQADSIRDFGGLYIVHGKYLLEGAVSINAKYAQMLDGTYLDEFESEKCKIQAANPDLVIDFLHCDFREKEIFAEMKSVDVSILYDVLLHQDNAVEVIRNVASKTKKYIVIAQPCLKESIFPLPNCCVNIQIMDEQTKDELREGSFWPKEEPTDRFKTQFWMWGQTTTYIVSVLKGLGWCLEDGFNVEGICGKYWDYPIMRFKPENLKND